MNKLLRLIGISFTIISLLSFGLLYVTSVNYLNYTETVFEIPQNIRISEVRIPLITDESQDQTVEVLFDITNPSSLTVFITGIEAYIYMDNLSDARSFFEKMDEVLVGIGQFNLQKADSHIIRPGESMTIPVYMTVSGGSVFMSILNTTSNEKYYPYVFGTLWYTFDFIDLIEVVRGVSFLGGRGVEPY
ncbi:MAG: hypothetical protein V3U51_05470 [Thermoplasmata archaeon]